MNTINTLALWRFIVKNLNRLRYLIMSPPAATETLPAMDPTATATKSQETAGRWPKGVLSQAMVEPSAAWTKVVPKPHLPGYPMLKPAFILKDTPTGSFESAEGYDHPVKAEVVYGSDWLTFDPDNKHARPHLKLLC
ncbi:MAG: hypothetical protein Q9164_005420, partial [Protoblastenia rupestris]